MYKIKEIASLFGISTQTIRYYEKVGLLTPTKIDSLNKYRYYSNTEIDQLSNIIQLRYLGFSIEEIRQYISCEFTKDTKISKLRKIIDICNNQIARINNVLESNETFCMQIKERSECSALHMKCHITTPLEISRLFNNMMTYAAKHKIVLREPINFVLKYQSNSPDTLNTDVDAYIIAEQPISKETVIIPAQTIATVFYQGHLEHIADAYHYLFEEIEKQQIQVIGYPMEQYFGPYNPIQNTCATEIQIPILNPFCLAKPDKI